MTKAKKEVRYKRAKLTAGEVTAMYTAVKCYLTLDGAENCVLRTETEALMEKLTHPDCFFEYYSRVGVRNRKR